MVVSKAWRCIGVCSAGHHSARGRPAKQQRWPSFTPHRATYWTDDGGGQCLPGVDLEVRSSVSGLDLHAEFNVHCLLPRWSPCAIAECIVCLLCNRIINIGLHQTLVENLRLHRGSLWQVALENPMGVCYPKELSTPAKVAERRALQP